MQTIDFYIVVHDIKLIRFFEETKKYERLRNYKYLFVGTHEFDYTDDKIIQCNRLVDNIETKNNFLAYTAWYALAKNTPPVSSKYICFLEYDTDLLDTFDLDKFCEQVYMKNMVCCGLTYMPITEGIFCNTIFTYKTLDYLKERNIKELTLTNKNWMTTNNMIFMKNFLIEYFNDKFTLDFFQYLGNDKMSGHFLERFLSIYCFVNKLTFDIIDNSGLQHRGFDSHNTQNIYYSGRGYEQFKITNKISDKV